MTTNEINPKENQVLILKVTNILENRKVINLKGGAVKHRHDIYLENKEGLKMQGEYLSVSPYVSEDFILNVFQFVKIKKITPLSIEIEPSEDPALVVERRQLEKDLAPRSNGPAPVKNCYNIPVSGSSITFSMAYAKDILVAEISRKPEGYKVTEEDIKNMIVNADLINAAICDRVSF